jgi:hypothetical protein
LPHIKVSGNLDGTTTFIRKGGFMWFSIDHRKEEEEDFSIYVLKKKKKRELELEPLQGLKLSLT